MQRNVSLQLVWFERDATTGARIELAPASMPRAVAEAVSKMFERVRNPVRLARTRGLCSCGDCLGCDVQAARREHQERKGHAAHR